MGFFQRLLRSGIWLWLPPLVASFAFWPNLGPSYQPDIFWHDIPSVLGIVENTSRFGVITFSALLLMSWRTHSERTGWIIYTVGFALYALCQWAIVLGPTGWWATSAFGFLAPAYTPIIFVVGIGLIGSKPITSQLMWVRWLFWPTAVVFLFSHNTHALMVFLRTVAAG